MPYIPKEDRPPYNAVIKKALENIPQNEDVVVVGEYTAFFVHDVVTRFMGTYNNPYHAAFNSLFFDETRRKGLSEAAVEAAMLLAKTNDLVKQAGEMNYLVSAVIWGVIGESGKYALRAFIKGAVHHIIKTEIQDSGDMRRYLMVYGVLTDVIDETYRRKTASYEDDKMNQNGDIWPMIEEHALSPEEVAAEFS